MLHRTKLFLRALAGGTRDLDKKEVNQGTRNIYTAVGLLMLAVAVVSSGFAGYAWGNVFRSAWVGALAFMVWLPISLGVNYIIAWKIDQKHQGVLSRIFAVLVAFAFAGVLVYMNSMFMMMKTLQPEIVQQVETKYYAKRSALENELASHNAKYNQDLGQLRTQADTATQKITMASSAEVEKLRADVVKLRGEYDTALAAYTAEVDGRGNSRMVGEGSRARAKRAEAEERKRLFTDAEAQLAAAIAKLDPAVAAKVAEVKQNLTTDEARLLASVASDKARLERNIAELDAMPRNGFIDQHEALQGLVLRNPAAMYGFLALFFMLESLVVLSKLYMGKTEYHMMRAAEFAMRVNEQQAKIVGLDKSRRERELAERQAKAAHRKALRQIENTEREEQLADAEKQHETFNRHLARLEQMDVGEEVIQQQKDTFLNNRKNFLKLVASR